MQSIRVDAKGRITIGSLLPPGTTSVRVIQAKNGVIALEPLMEIPARELWLHKNAAAMQALKQGIAEAEIGNLIDADFSEFADK